MKLKLTFMNALCETDEFNINGIDAEHCDFGDKYDRDSDNADQYCCNDMQFTRKPSTKEVLDRYKITEEEYQEICAKLEDGLSFGGCGWCA